MTTTLTAVRHRLEQHHRAGTRIAGPATGAEYVVGRDGYLSGPWGPGVADADLDEFRALPGVFEVGAASPAPPPPRRAAPAPPAAPGRPAPPPPPGGAPPTPSEAAAALVAQRDEKGVDSLTRKGWWTLAEELGVVVDVSDKQVTPKPALVDRLIQRANEQGA